MTKAPLPDNEAQRIEALLEYKILDTPNETAFDDLTRLASYICGTPIALVSLVDTNRQWFKSKVGLEALETPRDIAFCAHGILQPDVFIVPDATADERFATNPLVTSDPNIRFYAGVPLTNPEGHTLGMFCVNDYVPRELSPEQIEALRILGRQVIKQLELRRNLANLTLATKNRKQAQKGHKEFFKKVAGGFGLASVILALIGTVSYRSTTELIATSNQVEKSQEKITKLEEIVSELKDAETGQRGYLLTGNESYLEPYLSALTAVPQEIKILKNITGDNLNDQKRINILEPLITAKLTELEETIELRRRKGLKSALQVVQTDKGKFLMDDIRNITHQMENEEKKLLKQHSAAAKVSAHNTGWILKFSICLGFIILAVVYYLIYSEFNQRKWVEESLKKERNFISAVVDTVGALVIVLDPQGQIVRFNSACEQITGYSFDEVRGRHFWNLFLLPEEVASVKATFAQLQAGQFPNHHENYWLTRDGSRRLISWSNSVIIDNQGAIEYIIGTGIDITDRQQAESELQKERELLKIVLDNIQAGIVACDPQGTLTLFNQTAREFHCLPETEILAEQWAEHYNLYLPDGKMMQKEDVPLFQALQGKRVYNCELMIVPKQGAKRTLLASGQAIIDAEGRNQGAVVAMHDISDRKRAEQHLNAQYLTNSVLAASNTTKEAAPRILQAICESLDWDLGEIWLIDQQANVLHCLEVWQRKSTQMPFEAVTRQTTFAWGVGLPGRVWANFEPIWMHDVTQDRNFSRTKLAAQAGLHTGFGFPIYSENQTLGVMTFCKQDSQQPDDELLRTITSIGSQVGQFIKRKQAESELHRQNQRSQLFTEITLKIRQSLQIQEILQITVTEVQKILQTDRVLIYQIAPDGGSVVAEAVVPWLPAIQGQNIIEPYLQAAYLQQYRQGHHGSPQIDLAEVAPKYPEFLQQFGVKANLVVPILVKEELCGLLIVHQCSDLRQWSSFEIELLQQLADQVGIALAQAQMLEAETRQRQELQVAHHQAQLASQASTLR